MSHSGPSPTTREEDSPDIMDQCDHQHFPSSSSKGVLTSPRHPQAFRNSQYEVEDYDVQGGRSDDKGHLSRRHRHRRQRQLMKALIGTQTSDPRTTATHSTSSSADATTFSLPGYCSWNARRTTHVYGGGTNRNSVLHWMLLSAVLLFASLAAASPDAAYDYGRDDYRGPWSPSVHQQQDEKVDEFEPLFKNNSETNVTVQAGIDSAFMPCRVKNLGEHVLHWVRHKESSFEILTTGLETYTADDRIQVLHDDENHEYTLQIKFVTEKDAGRYECQISTASGIIQTFINLSVLVPEAFILGNGDLHVNRGSTITLVCIVEKTLRPPKYVFWSHNQKLIDHALANSRITVKTEPGPSRTHSQLVVHNARGTDTGNYTCSTTGAEAHTYVFVEDDRTSAVQQIADSAEHVAAFPAMAAVAQLVFVASYWQVLNIADGVD